MSITHTDYRTDEGIAVGLIDGIISMCRVLRKMDTVIEKEAVVEALTDLKNDEDVNWAINTVFSHNYSEKTKQMEENMGLNEELPIYRIFSGLVKDSSGKIHNVTRRECRKCGELLEENHLGCCGFLQSGWHKNSHHCS